MRTPVDYSIYNPLKSKVDSDFEAYKNGVIALMKPIVLEMIYNDLVNAGHKNEYLYASGKVYVTPYGSGKYNFSISGSQLIEEFVLVDGILDSTNPNNDATLQGLIDAYVLSNNQLLAYADTVYFSFEPSSNIEIKTLLATKVVHPLSTSNASTIELVPSGNLKAQYVVRNYERIDVDFDKVQLLLHFDDSVGVKEFKDAKGHYPVGIKTTSVTQGAFGEGRESVVLLDGSDYGGIEISPNNARNEPSSFNLFQDITDITRASNVDWCIECFVGSEGATSESVFLQNSYLASNSYSENGGGIDWGIRLEPTKIVIVIGDIDYPFDIPVGYTFSKWEYVRAYGENGTLGIWLNDNYLGWYENVPTHEKRYHNYFRIGRAIAKESLRALLDEFRFTIGTARPEQNGLIPTEPFPNVGDFENRPKIQFDISATFEKTQPSYLDLAISLPKPSIAINLSAKQNGLSILIKQPEISINIAKTDGFNIYFELKNPVNFPLSIIQQGLDLALPVPAPTVNLSMEKNVDIDIFGSVPAPLIDMSMKVVPTISIVATIPDLNTPALATPNLNLPVSIPLPAISLAISLISGGKSDIALTIPKPTFNLTISPYDATILDVAVIVPAPKFNLTISPPIEIFGIIKPPKIFIDIARPPEDLSQWFNSLLNVSTLQVENHIYVKLPHLAPKISMKRNTELAIKVVTPKLKTSLSMASEKNSLNQISIPVTLPTLEIDISHRVINLSLSINPPIIHLQSLTSSAFL